jgi:serine phosphatase RsbU (regulator of sigma subunit)
MGIFPGEKFENCSFELQPGETLLLFSDGFEVAFSPAPEHGQKARAMRDPDELEHYVQRLATIRWPDGRNGRSATEAMDELARLIDTQAGSLHQIDDLTAIAISCTADVASGRESFSAAA